MAYITAERVKEIRTELKKQFPRFKFSVRRDHCTGISVSILAGPVRFSSDDYDQLNHYHLHLYKHENILRKMLAIINKWNFDHSDSMTDYFHVGYYVSLNQGKWNRPYQQI